MDIAGIRSSYDKQIRSPSDTKSTVTAHYMDISSGTANTGLMSGGSKASKGTAKAAVNTSAMNKYNSPVYQSQRRDVKKDLFNYSATTRDQKSLNSSTLTPG